MSDTWQIVWAVVAILVVILLLIAVAIWIARPVPSKKPERVWHALPPIRGDGSLPCCGRYPHQVPMQDMLTPVSSQVTCGLPDTPRGPRRAAA